MSYLAASTMKEKEAFTTLGHRNTEFRVLAGGCFQGICCLLLTTFSKWYWNSSFGFMENYGHFHLSSYTKIFALKSSGRRYAAWFNDWPTLGTRARAVALVQSGEDFCKAGYLSLVERTSWCNSRYLSDFFGTALGFSVQHCILSSRHIG